MIECCSAVYREGQDGTWITRAMVDGYTRLYQLGFAHSVEAWDGEELVGGLYGVSLGDIFFGESMFAVAPDASKVAFVALARQLQAWRMGMVDSQVRTEHLARFGAEDIPRSDYLARLRRGLRTATRQGRWSFEGDPYELALGGE